MVNAFQPAAASTALKQTLPPGHPPSVWSLNITGDASLAAEAETIAGRKNIPVVQFKDGEFMVEPSDADLHAALTKRGLI